jgi:hypothetical protein
VMTPIFCLVAVGFQRPLWRQIPSCQARFREARKILSLFHENDMTISPSLNIWP